jgi:iron(III) transport system substrate-binding protein
LLLSASVACGPQSSAPPAATSAPTAAAKPTTAPAATTASAATSAPAAKPTAASGATTASSASADAEMADLAAKAKQEGELVIFLGRAGSRQLLDAFPQFEQKYGVKITPVIGSGNESADKVLAERDTGLYTGDLWMGGLTTLNTRLLPKGVLDPIESQLVLPEVKDQSVWYKGKHWFGDPDQKYTFLFGAGPSPLLSYNTDKVKEEDLTSFAQLLEPQWKGKMVSRDPTAAGTGGNTAFFYFNPQLGQDYLRKLYTQQDVTIIADARQAAEALALGKYSIYLVPSGTDVTEMSDQGLPVKDLLKPLKEGARIAAGGTGSISVFNKAAHPNAAKLFINWWLSKEGQIVAQTANPVDQSLRTDIPIDMVTPEYRRQPGIDYLFMDGDPQVVGHEDDMLAFMKGVLASK